MRVRKNSAESQQSDFEAFVGPESNDGKRRREKNDMAERFKCRTVEKEMITWASAAGGRGASLDFHTWYR